MSIVENSHLHYTLNSMLFIEEYVKNYGDRSVLIESDSLTYLIDYFNKDDVEYSLQSLNREYYAQRLYGVLPYVHAIEELKFIYENTSNILLEVKDFRDIEANSNSMLTLCSKNHKNSYRVNLESLDKEYILTINRGFLGTFADLWNSNTGHVLYAKDNYDGYYKFVFDGEYYKLKEAYSLNVRNELLYKNLNYITPIGKRIILQ